MKNEKRDTSVYTFLNREPKLTGEIIEYGSWMKGLEDGVVSFDEEILVEFIVLTQPWIIIGGLFYEYSGGVYRYLHVNTVMLRIAEMLPMLPFYQMRQLVILKTLRNDDRMIVDTSFVNCNKNLINVRNGLYDLTTGKLLPHTPEYISTVQINAYYDSEANGEHFQTFLNTIAPEEHERALIQKMFGEVIKPQPSGCFFMIYGPVRSGKSVLMNVVSGMFEKPILDFSDHCICQLKNGPLNQLKKGPLKLSSNGPLFLI